MRKLILVLLLGCAACTTQADDPAPPSAGAQRPAPGTAPGDTFARMKALVGAASCTASDQCRTVALGANACGGPQGYLPYSTAGTDEKALLELAARFKAERQAEIKARGEMSTCQHIPDPGAVCTSGTCQLGASSPSAPSAR